MEAQLNAQKHFYFKDFAKQAASRLALALGLTLGFVLIELVAGIFANSLVLITDAAHNFTDAIALALSWWALRLAAQPSNSRKTFGYHRAGILVALINATSLVIISLGIFHEAYQRLVSPPEVKSSVLIGVGALAFLVNVGTAWLVKRGSEQDLNLRSAFLHLMGDVFSTLGAVIAGVIIFFSGMNWLDPLVSFFIGLLILWNSWGILRESVDILLEGTPHDIDMGGMVEDLRQIKGVLGVHDLHVWSITRNLRTMSAHILTYDIPISETARIQNEINQLLRHHYLISHSTLQFECVGCEPELLYCDLNHTPHLY